MVVNWVTDDITQILTMGSTELGGDIMSLGGFDVPTPVSSVGCNGTYTGARQKEKRLSVWLLSLGISVGILGAVML